ncbi:unnamed protein product [Brugia pahangi]|uniref:Uncharacterized protein n=1 Tax=Brugia pahangi TaxID=6280 RepID=A0A0N4TC64_BRUPA|nr:unnamed protein product [Brugia pahangi]
MRTDAEDNYTHQNSSSVIEKDSLQNNQFYWNSPSVANKNTEHISVPASTLSTGQHNKVNVKSKIPISTVGPQHSTSPLLSSSSSNATSSKRNNDGNSKLFKFSSNALRF